MKVIRLLTMAATTASLAFASGSTGGGLSGGGISAGRCPVTSIQGSIAGVDLERDRLVIATGDQGQIEVPVGPETKYRVQGYKKKQLENDPLAKIEVGAPAKVSYCADDATVLEVKVKKKKHKDLT